MLYLTLNQACVNMTGVDIPEEVMKILYQYHKTNLNNQKLFDKLTIFKYNFTLEERLYNNTLKELKDKYKNNFDKSSKSRAKNYFPYNSGKNNNMVKKDYIDHMVFMKYYGDVVKSMNEFKNDLLHYYDKTNKRNYITYQQYVDLQVRVEAEAKEVIMDNFPYFCECGMDNYADVQKYDYETDDDDDGNYNPYLDEDDRLVEKEAVLIIMKDFNKRRDELIYTMLCHNKHDYIKHRLQQWKKSKMRSCQYTWKAEEWDHGTNFDYKTYLVKVCGTAYRPT